MRRSVALVLMLLCAQVAWGEEGEIVGGLVDKMLLLDEGIVAYDEGNVIHIKREETEVNRFLAEKVKPEIEKGDKAMRGYAIDGDHTTAIAHYLKALVLIEEERLRRRK